ncbi:transmembrane protein 237A isoform X1 [Myxocyprinus asiaticus]|uniref:transmembrane protein 237A isoform X1 n=1 Tax=Myxocyprinus asiaticus TaxID=70543 RepID=UPI0022238125|nr:transmembrane protein 237A isoform X1 [Myxocyprinus asiaticus]XP_051564595.1 transmembrane protein 237A isoform X1 [Myxocyprinus asiaticus]XP_051564596.1 transmembrane protein 237A isoform X1 [Myxocyprinus asiaticus]XP_051564597.1 transmembrane protein 237A isoform X1 [Myxocyprinus asiaticus]XP_051564598.1 transmembrane protein 237A isoform X1 [Myxocyprinus asiaticus]XP_051564599.1 transmembrane protein 237A isoform X1 [Myxocyprinus asiaticus]XP_051564600.1 transmembrane protein 237A isofo
MPSVKHKKKKVKKEINEVEEPEAGTEPAIEMEGLESRRQSESREPLTPEPQENPPQRKKKKKKAHPLDYESEQQDLANGDVQEPHTDGEEVTKKTKRKRKAKLMENQSHNELGVEEDDIITDVHAPISQRSLFSAPLGHSHPTGKVFVENNPGRFQANDHLDLSRDQLEEYMEVRPMLNTRDVAMRVHSGFRIIGLFSHGFLAGYAVWNIIVVYVLAGEQLTKLPNLLQQYHSLAYPAQSLLYLLLAISTVSAFDRVNLAKASMALRGFLSLDPAALASFLYFAALILSLSQQMTSDRIHLYPTANETLWPPGSEHQILQPWIVVNLVVALLVGLAWVFVATRPDMDYTEDFLMAMEVEEFPRHVEKIELAA